MLNYPETIRFRCTQAMHEQISQDAKRAQMSIGTFVRETYNGGTVIVIDEMKSVLKELKKTGNNLNQLTVLSNMGKIKSPDLTAVKNQYSQIMAELIHINRSINALKDNNYGCHQDD